MEFFGIPFFDNDFYKLIFRFTLNIIFLTIIIRYFYYKNSKNKDYVFSYYLISIIVFFICFTLKKFELDLGMALGLFAVFRIIRFRTSQIEIKEITYLFIVIGVSVINSLANKKVSYIEIITANLLIIAAIAIIDGLWRLRNETSKKITYEKIENIKPENYELMKADLEERTGLQINRIEIGNVNFLRDTADVTIYYFNGNSKNKNK